MPNTPFERRLRVSNSVVSIKAWDPDASTGTGTGTVVSNDVKSKAIVTITSSNVITGLQAAPIQFLYTGTLSSVAASLTASSKSDLIFDVQQCTELSYNSANQVWNSILTAPCTIAAGSLSATASIISYTTIAKGVYVRVIVTSTAQDATGLVVETIVGVN